MRLAHITKSFGRAGGQTRAVDDVSLEVSGGEILALVGENGAGKSTLMRIAAGELEADSGEVLGRTSVGFVHQHFLLVPELTIAENLAVTAPGFRFATVRTLEREAAATIASSGIDLRDPSRRVADLSVGEKSKLELIKAIARRPATLILDEPTSVLTPHESAELFAMLRTLAAGGTGIVFISHKLPEVLAVAQRVVVLRRGKLTLETSSPTAQEVTGAMLDAPLALRDARSGERGAVVLRHGDLLVHAQEIVAIVGVAGNGQAELAEQLRDVLPDAGHIPEDRARDGVIAEMSIAENLALKPVLNAAEVMDRYSIRAHSPRQRAGELSGGNQQKVVLARALAPQPRVIVAAEPTRGLDLDATRFVHGRLLDAASTGAAVLLITSDLEEAFALADTIQVIYRGKLSERMTAAEATQRVAGLMAGIA